MRRFRKLRSAIRSTTIATGIPTKLWGISACAVMGFVSLVGSKPSRIAPTIAGLVGMGCVRPQKGLRIARRTAVVRVATGNAWVTPATSPIFVPMIVVFRVGMESVNREKTPLYVRRIVRGKNAATKCVNPETGEPYYAQKTARLPVEIVNVKAVKTG